MPLLSIFPGDVLQYKLYGSSAPPSPAACLAISSGGITNNELHLRRSLSLPARLPQLSLVDSTLSLRLLLCHHHPPPPSFPCWLDLHSSGHNVQITERRSTSYVLDTVCTSSVAQSPKRKTRNYTQAPGLEWVARKRKWKWKANRDDFSGKIIIITLELPLSSGY